MTNNLDGNFTEKLVSLGLQKVPFYIQPPSAVPAAHTAEKIKHLKGQKS